MFGGVDKARVLIRAQRGFAMLETFQRGGRQNRIHRTDTVHPFGVASRGFMGER